MDAVTVQNERDLADLVCRHVQRVRQLEGFSTATAIVVCEDNIPFCAGSVYYELRERSLSNAVLLYLGKALGRGSKRDSAGVTAPDHQPGDLSPGIWTTRENKRQGLEVLHRAMRDGRMHMHRDFVTYSRADERLEMQRAEDAGFDLVRMVENHGKADLNDGRGRLGVAPVVPAIPGGEFASRVHQALAAVEKVRVERLVFKEFGWMRSIVTRSKTARSDLELVNVRVTGKGGRDPEDGSERRDDLVMALVMVVLGAAGFYLHPNYLTERARLGVF